MSGTSHDKGLEASGLRERLPQQSSAPRKATSPESAQETVMALNSAEEKAHKSEKDRKTYGRTPDGT
ncbi:phosphatidylethanolamine N-methyltransferase, partial [Cryomyces antarcticus]